tara:strand:- start:268 stop:444 length:177 start_codon:yes stop_codon:yes gene_type:complete
MKKIIDDAFDIRKEKHLNKNNIIFKDKKYLDLYNRVKEVDDDIKERRQANANTETSGQ